jgi:hypothetical protein
MCGGVIFPFKQAYRQALEQFYQPEDLDLFDRVGHVRSLFWQKSEPVLPIIIENGELAGTPDAGELIVRWGNRDRTVPFPQTGWARIDSIYAGKWDYLKPEPVIIPVTYGVEKGRWFRITGGIRGLLVQRGQDRRVYMLTDEADEQYAAVTGHPRMPMLMDQTDFDWIAGDPMAQFLQRRL